MSSPGCKAVWKPPGRGERLISVEGWITVGLLYVGYFFCLPENNHLEYPFCFCSKASWWATDRDALALDPTPAAGAQFTRPVATNYSHQSLAGSGRRCLFFPAFYPTLVTFTDFGKFISEEEPALITLKVRKLPAKITVNKKHGSESLRARYGKRCSSSVRERVCWLPFLILDNALWWIRAGEDLEAGRTTRAGEDPEARRTISAGTSNVGSCPFHPSLSHSQNCISVQKIWLYSSWKLFRTSFLHAPGLAVFLPPDHITFSRLLLFQATTSNYVPGI